MRPRWPAATLGSLAAVLAVVPAALLALPSLAAAQTIGANLARPANAPYGCETLPTIGPFGERIFQTGFGAGAPTCTYLGTNLAESTGAPGPGIVTAVRVKV